MNNIPTLAPGPERGAEGVLAWLGTGFGGWNLFVQDGKLQYVHPYLKIKEYDLASDTPLILGTQYARLPFHAPDEVSQAEADFGDVTLLIDGKPAGELKDVKPAAL